MADFRPFRGLRYRAEPAGELGLVLAPPYDVIAPEQQTALLERSPYNIIRLELGETRPGDDEGSNRYTRAAATLEAWRREGVVALEDEPVFYVYTQEFEFEGAHRRRTAVLGRLRVDPWETGVVRPHEETLAKPKADRLQLLRHLRTNVSPVFATVRRMDVLLPGELLFEATTPEGQHYSLSAVRDPEDIAAIAAAWRTEPVYILDGHHRFETALTYREECKARASAWTGEEPENFALAAITTADDPGLALLPIHRLVRPASVPADVIARLQRYFDVEDVSPKSYDGTALLRLLARVSASGTSGVAFGALGLEEGRLHLLTLRDVAAVRALMPERSSAWQALDVSVLEYAVLRETLDVMENVPELIEYTEDVQHAHREVEAGRWPLAFLLNPTRIEEMLSVADAGERMPPKSTFFYPKLATGLVLNPVE